MALRAWAWLSLNSKILDLTVWPRGKILQLRFIYVETDPTFFHSLVDLVQRRLNGTVDFERSPLIGWAPPMSQWAVPPKQNSWTQLNTLFLFFNFGRFCKRNQSLSLNFFLLFVILFYILYTNSLSSLKGKEKKMLMENHSLYSIISISFS